MSNLIDNAKLLEAVGSSGYEFEVLVQNLFRKYNWNTISNRYYIDDVKGIEREIDIIAYKCKEINDIIYYTVLIISCKKSSEHIWTFLTQAKKDDLNFDYFPMQLVASDARLSTLIQYEHKKIIEKAKANESICKVYDCNNRVLAYLQVRKSNWQQDSNSHSRIYDSIITSIKALEAEKDSHKATKIDNKCTFYNLNALSVFDGLMAEVLYDEENKKVVNHVDDVKYINRHLVNKKEHFYRVHFVSASKLEQAIIDYDNLYMASNSVYSGLIDYFYKDIWSYNHRIDLYLKEFIQEVNLDLRFLKYSINDPLLKPVPQVVSIMFSIKDNILYLSIDFGSILKDDVINFLNQNKKAKDIFAIALKRKYRYNGSFIIDQDYLPF